MEILLFGVSVIVLGIMYVLVVEILKFVGEIKSSNQPKEK